MGFKCPWCGKDSWTSAQLFWNLWQCLGCDRPSTIQNGVMEAYSPGGPTEGSEDAKAEAALRRRQSFKYPDSSGDTREPV